MSSVRKIQLPDNTTVDINDSRVYVYRTVTGTAAVTETPFYCSRWNVTDETVTQYTDGMVVCLKVPVAGNGTYGTGFQINNLGYKPVVYNVSSMVSTRYGVGSVVWAVYNSTQTASLYLNSDSATTVTGCWQVNDYGTSDTNSIGYQLRTNSSVRPTVSRTRYYRILFSSADNTKWVPANTKYDNSATSVKPVNTTPINPFGRIVYMSGTTNVTAGSNVGSGVTWDQYALTLGYSFNTTGSALTLTYPAPVYVKCEPQADGSAIIDSTTPYVQALPSTADGKIYIYLGQAYSETQVEMTYDHPIYYHDGTQIRQYSGDKTGDTLPSQSGNSGKFLTTDGTSASWATVSAGSSTLSALTDTTITTPSDGQVLTYDNATSKWVNGDVPEEVLACTLTVATAYNSETGNTDISYSCDKTAAEIYAAYTANKSVFLKTTGDDASDYNGPETNVIYRLDVAYSYTGPNSNPYYYIFFKSQISAFVELVKTAMPGMLGRAFHNLSLNLLDGDLPTDLPTSAGWHFSNDALRISPNIVHGNLPQMDGNTINDSGISATSVSTAITNSHTHSNKTILDYIPSSLGTAGQVLRVNSGATGLEFGTVSGGLTNYDFTHTANTTVSGSTTTVTFAANTRGSVMLTISADLGLTIACNNGSDNYIWIKNTGSSEVDVTISGVTKNSTSVSNVYVPSDGISVPAGGLCEIGVIVNTDGAFLTSRNDLAL